MLQNLPLTSHIYAGFDAARAICLTEIELLPQETIDEAIGRIEQQFYYRSAPLIWYLYFEAIPSGTDDHTITFDREESYARSLEARQPSAIVEESEEGLDCAAIEVSYEGLRHPCIGGGEKPPPHQVIH
ncbi:hypothetical protein TRIUR3_13047 [Triticum urartu]|uniref:Uncharacterized protein n=1 Tax=Triticum urartu TaxID=4572 RepID=M7ZBA2_TRIUA|nr:hypothetical protein TRIUR3_13047 [Triticum urartu]